MVVDPGSGDLHEVARAVAEQAEIGSRSIECASADTPRRAALALALKGCAAGRPYKTGLRGSAVGLRAPMRVFAKATGGDVKPTLASSIESSAASRRVCSGQLPSG